MPQMGSMPTMGGAPMGGMPTMGVMQPMHTMGGMAPMPVFTNGMQPMDTSFQQPVGMQPMAGQFVVMEQQPTIMAPIAMEQPIDLATGQQPTYMVPVGQIGDTQKPYASAD